MGMATPSYLPSNRHLPPHLRELCDLLARGLLRLRSRTVEDLACDATRAADRGETSLHFRADQSVHANRTTRRPA